MHKKDLIRLIRECYTELKDFQLATVKVIDRKFYIEKKKRHLLADEVGLGKTIVAKGVIARAMERHLGSAARKKPFRVVYVCSNQALTGQNLNKLNIFKNKDFVEDDRGRLVFQAFKEENNSPYQLSSLTPSTSFRLKKGTGIRRERKLIWMLLTESRTFRRKKRHDGLKLVMLGNVKERFVSRWMNKLDEYKRKNLERVRPAIIFSFKQRVDRELIDLNQWYYKPVRDELSLTGSISLKNILVKYAELLTPKNVKRFEGPKRLLGILRKLLTDECLDFFGADIYILDEFQRFKDLIEPNPDKQSDAAIIAQKVFGSKKAKVLMLSATPFKPFTTALDAEFEEEHYKELEAVISFLFEHKLDKVNAFRNSRKAFFSMLRRPETISMQDIPEKINLENLYRKVISRTERLIVSDDRNSLLRNRTIALKPTPEDIRCFVATDTIIGKLGEVAGKGGHTLVDFSKSAPFPLSFMDKYKVKEDLKSHIRKSPKLQLAAKSNPGAWLALEKVQHYKPLDDIPNGNMRLLIEAALHEHDLWRQLWIAPSLPYYELRGSFKNAANSSKILIFSKWRMVPRAIATLVSYEAERLSIGNEKLIVEGEKLYTPDFYPNNPGKRQPRKPTKVLALKMKEDKPQKMTAYTLLYPSMALASCFDLRENIKMEHPASLLSIKEAIKQRLDSMIRDAGLQELITKTQKTVNWYWAAPLLLDKHLHHKTYSGWLEQGIYNRASILRKKRAGDVDESDAENDSLANATIHDPKIDEEESANSNITVQKHFLELTTAFSNPADFGFGEFPDDLLDVLALQVIASPAVCSLRILKEFFPEIDDHTFLNRALDIASEFHALFDKPESISVIKIASLERDDFAHDDTYWKDVLEYCVNGNLQAVLDEFAHLISYDFKTIQTFTERILSSINIRTSSIRVDNSTSVLDKKPTNMRCHYAVDFGTQNMEVETGLNRITSVLANFNSPFRPFVLASTSIGQEGLDFHYYCRKVMHWNLPANPIDVEQREGRVNRFKGLVIRQNLAKKYAKYLPGSDGNIWDYLFTLAEQLEGKDRGKSQLVPFWHIEPDGVYIDRMAPLIPFSREVKQMEKILTTLTLYRLTFGQPRQEELVEVLYKELSEEEIRLLSEKLLINLSPIVYLNENTGFKQNQLQNIIETFLHKKRK